jgi:hypothetical protein
MDKLLARHHLHRRIAAITAKNQVACRMTMEFLVMALRMRVIPFKVLEMAS